MKKILAAVDGSEIAGRVIDFAVELAIGQKAEVCFVHVIREKKILSDTVWKQIEGVYQALAEEIVASAAKQAYAQGAKDVETEVLGGDPAQSIVDYAIERQVDAILLGSHGQGQVSGLVLGSVAYKVLALARCTVIVVR